MMRKVFLWMQKYERHLSALAMVAGFAADNVFFERVDLWQTQLLFASYAVACFIAIPLLHWIEMRTGRLGGSMPRWRLLLPLVTQFALGGFWSGFVIFYGRSAELGASWPFLLLMFLIFLGSEYFHQYHARLVFTSVLFFFALYSYAIFAVPIYTGTMGTVTFLESGAVAVGIFALFTILLRILARERFRADVWRIRFGAFLVLLVMNIFYFTNILPPLPLSAKAGGIYHNVWRAPGEYLGAGEVGQSWQVRYLGFAPTLHIAPSDSVSAYSSVFAPTTLATTIVHRWEYHDPGLQTWVRIAAISYPIVGGRDGGYRGYSTVQVREAGQWRVNIETSDGRLIERLPFNVELVPAPVPLTASVLD
jgi:MFS family permease